MINIFPLRRVEFEGAWTYIPRKSKEVLDLQYGKGNWEEEIDCKHVLQEQCVHAKEEVKEPIVSNHTQLEDQRQIFLLFYLLCFILSLVILFFLTLKCIPSS